MTIDHIIRAAIPWADAATVEHVLWGCTAFPFVRLTAKSLYKAADGYRRATEKGKTLCFCCNNLAVTGQWECAKCAEVLRNARPAAVPA